MRWIDEKGGALSYEEIRASHHKAKKEYPCEWCNEKILVGEKYLSRVYRFEGDFNAGRMHLECEQGMKNSSYDAVLEGWYPGEFNRGESVR